MRKYLLLITFIVVALATMAQYTPQLTATQVGSPCTGVGIGGFDADPNLPAHITVRDGDTGAWLFSQDYGSLSAPSFPGSEGFNEVNIPISWFPTNGHSIHVIVYHFLPAAGVPDSDYTHIWQWLDVTLACVSMPFWKIG